MDIQEKIDKLVMDLRRITRTYSRPAFSCSYSIESVLLFDIIARYELAIEVFTIDTGRLHEHNYRLIDELEQRYKLAVKTYYPDSTMLQMYANSNGQNAFYYSLESRKSCCYVRKVEPLERALSGKDAWVTGLRREQSISRAELREAEWDTGYLLKKFNPIWDWTTEEVWAYIEAENLPYNALYDAGYTSIGCAPCTRAVSDGEDLRAGRWWWEPGATKECGLHEKRIVFQKRRA